MTISTRRFSPLAALRALSAPRLVLAAASALALSTGMLAGAAAPAGAIVKTVGSATVGLQPRDATHVYDGHTLEEPNEPMPETFANPSGNPVLHKSETFVIYWDPADRYHGDWQHLIDGFLANVGSDSGSLGAVFSVDGQYTDKSNEPAYYRSTYKGAYTDTEKYPVAGCTDPDPVIEDPFTKMEALSCLTDTQVQEQLETFIAAHGLPKGMNTIFYLLTPPGVTVCLDGAATHCSDYSGSEKEKGYEDSFCSYHSAINPGETPTGDGSTILYGVIPWIAGGEGDGDFAPGNQTQAYACQDGAFDPTSKPIEKKEHAKEKSAAEKEEFEKKDAEEKQAVEEAEALSAPHEQEPNQVPCPSSDGYCDTGLADLIINQIAVEQQNIVTDPLLNAWKDDDGDEATDECRNFYASGNIGGGVTALPGSFAGTLYNQTIGSGDYYLNNAFNLAALKLQYPGIPCLGGVTLVPQFTVPNVVNSGETVGFDGMESDIALNAATRYSSTGTPEANYATYSWNFGDGTAEVSGYAPGAPACETPWLSPCAASVFHSYRYGGVYTVTLKVTDVGGNVASISRPVTVSGAPAPVEVVTKTTETTTPPTTTTGTTTPAPGSSPGSTPAGTSPTLFPAPVAAAAVTSRSLRTVLRKGLVVRYSVNEQVAGQFQVLLSSAIAHKLGIAGTPATGLPAGSAPELVIAKAILVTTKGGRSSVDIQFSKRTAARLARLHKVTLMLRFVVRNASSGTPTTTTVISSVTLGH